MRPAAANAAAAELWNGDEGAHWAAHRERYDAMAAPVNAHLFAAARIGREDHVLDIGCGTGETTRIAARHALHGRATGVDLSGPMIGMARRLAAAAGLRNVTFEQGDAQIHPFSPSRFDVAVSRAGVMFFADPVEAFANVRRALAPGGRLVFVCHGDANTATRDLFGALTEHLPAPDEAQEPDLFDDRDRVHGMLEAAGFTAAASRNVEYPSVLGRDARDAAEFLFTAQFRAFVAGAEEASVARARDAVEATLRRYETDGAVRFPAPAWVVTARAS